MSETEKLGEIETKISDNKKLKLRFRCRKAGCGGKLEGKPDEILNDKEHKFTIKCPLCASEFSGGRRFIIQADQIKGICDVFKTLFYGNNSFDFSIYEEFQTEDGVTVEPEKKPEIDWSKLKA